MKEDSPVPYVLIINDEMFTSKTFLTDRPKPKEIINVLGIIFICKNKNRELKPNEPVIAEIDTHRHAPVKTCKDTLLAAGFRQLTNDEVKELRLHFMKDEEIEAFA